MPSFYTGKTREELLALVRSGDTEARHELRRFDGRVISLPRPRTFTSNEQLVEALRNAIFEDGRTYKVIALEVGVGKNTIGKIANGTTRWPKPTTLFPLMAALGYGLKMEKTK